LDLFKKFRPKKRRQTKKVRQKSTRKSKQDTKRQLTWWLAGVALVVVLGVGWLNWTRSGQGRAALLTLGSNKMYSEVQNAVDAALVAKLSGFVGGPADLPFDHDWPAPGFGAGAMVRCRKVTVTSPKSWWEIQAEVGAIVAEVGGRILWGERLLPERLGKEQLQANEDLDLLRLDIGVTGRPTHTLVLARADNRTPVHWGGGPGLSRWSKFAGGEGPVVALILDDWGHGKTSSAMSILSLQASFTMAVLPDLPYSRFFCLQKTDLVLPPGQDVDNLRSAQLASAEQLSSSRTARLAAGCPVNVSVGRRKSSWPPDRREIMLHFPMEPQGYPETNPGPNPILVGMEEAEIEARLIAALGTLTNVSGLNNHMGSAATSDPATMRSLMNVIKETDLFFVDSLTSVRSAAYAEAVRANIPAARNRIFLDYDNENEGAIARNLARLVDSARSAGFAVGIGHLHPATASVLAREIPKFIRDGVRFVTISELMAVREFRNELAAEEAR
jgi:polysaccharide deacetylase 2 family uncharacterized protein YibQ